MQEDKDIKLTIAPTPAEETAVQEELALASASVEEKIDKDLTENAQDAANQQDPTAKTLEDIMEEEAHESETQPPSNFSLSRTLGGAILAHVIQSQIKLVLLITFFLIIL